MNAVFSTGALRQSCILAAGLVVGVMLSFSTPRLASRDGRLAPRT